MTTVVFIQHVQQLLAEFQSAVRYSLTGQVAMDKEGDSASDIGFESNTVSLEPTGKYWTSYMFAIEKDLKSVIAMVCPLRKGTSPWHGAKFLYIFPP
ncbi:hypothetical protein [Pseudarthrobacter sp. BRE9]|uniref:hypothetical protein n=1 Tax=Pseudarthrobacter sp. BRE9 TaxID=2962582 RepID=UPI002881FD44|nr:hypothetical protein [Pseudarthrobacter sp. BRE9]MDT0169778.1 hypothetical protein [Pseudarthrobacter sp. BRE9]